MTGVQTCALPICSPCPGCQVTATPVSGSVAATLIFDVSPVSPPRLTTATLVPSNFVPCAAPGTPSCSFGCQGQADLLWYSSYQNTLHSLLINYGMTVFTGLPVRRVLNQLGTTFTNSSQPEGLILTVHAEQFGTLERDSMELLTSTQVSTTKGDVYIDPVPDRATTSPPINLPPNPVGGHTLHVSRISDAVINALWWFAGVEGYLNAPYLFSVLDTNITVHVFYNNLDYGVPKDGVLTMKLEMGQVNATCIDVNNVAAGNHSVFKFHFRNAGGHGNLTYQPIRRGLALQVEDWDLNVTDVFLDYPPVFLPAEFIADMSTISGDGRVDVSTILGLIAVICVCVCHSGGCGASVHQIRQCISLRPPRCHSRWYGFVSFGVVCPRPRFSRILFFQGPYPASTRPRSRSNTRAGVAAKTMATSNSCRSARALVRVG